LNEYAFIVAGKNNKKENERGITMGTTSEICDLIYSLRTDWEEAHERKEEAMTELAHILFDLVAAKKELEQAHRAREMHDGKYHEHSKEYAQHWLEIVNLGSIIDLVDSALEMEKEE